MLTVSFTVQRFNEFADVMLLTALSYEENLKF